MSEHQFGQFDSWTIIDENTARKRCDKSFYQYKESGIPQEIRWYFNVESIRAGERVDIVLIHDGFEYDGRIQKTDDGADRTRIFWNTALAEKFQPFENDGEQHVIEFQRRGDNRYNVELKNVDAEGKVWLISWNKDNWAWGNFSEICEQTKQGQTFTDSWACTSKLPKIGEEVFLIKLGEEPRGIIGHGFVKRTTYEKPHYNPSKAAEGKMISSIDVEFDRLIDYENENYLSQKELVNKCASQHWSPQNSGIEIKPEVLPVLRLLWEAVTSSSEAEEWWPSLSEYDPGLAAEDYHELFLNEGIVKRPWLEALYEMYEMPNHLGTCKQMGDRYGYAPTHYISYLSSIASNILKATGYSFALRDEGAKYWPILFQGKYTSDKSQGNYVWKMREPVISAMRQIIDEGVFDAKEDETMAQFDHNTILYGPPGTGKTYLANAVCSEIKGHFLQFQVLKFIINT